MNTSSAFPEEALPLLRQTVKELLGEGARVMDARLLAGGAYRRNWLVEVAAGARALSLVYREPPPPDSLSLPPELEVKAMKAARAQGVPVPWATLLPDGGILMEYVEGESSPRRLHRMASTAEGRRALVEGLARALASMHSVSLEAVAGLPAPAPGQTAALHQLERWQRLYIEANLPPSPVLELALRELRARLPPPSSLVLVHGDFRLANFVVGPEGLRAVLDWEGAHLGDPLEDVAWLCSRPWRYGRDGLPVAGLATREELLRAYQAASGRTWDERAWAFWEGMALLRWGVFCRLQAARASTREGDLPALAVGRRLAEAEWELLHLLTKA